jgi:hypothetical protein
MGERPERLNQRSIVEELADALLGSHALDWARKPIFEPIEFQTSTWLEEFNRWQTEFADALRAALTPVASWATKTAPAFALIRQIELLNKVHWIAHPALPIGDLIGEQSDPEIIGKTVADYVEQHLEDIYQILEIRFSSYNSGDQTKAFALELVEAHRHRLFHLIVPAVFPEVERCARDVFGLGAGKGAQVVINALTEGINNLTISEIGSIHALSVLSMMEEYFYESIYSETDADKFKSMIHRHGSQHGLLRYSESRDCLNAIFLFDFVLLGCDALRKP